MADICEVFYAQISNWTTILLYNHLFFCCLHIIYIYIYILPWIKIFISLEMRKRLLSLYAFVGAENSIQIN